ncbi:MAG: tetratricopeptide repeat protein [Betaproteobacteria bacterium]|nr:tetratricopeptide repeat protein [Betaproteobacteria bacterium]
MAKSGPSQAKLDALMSHYSSGRYPEAEAAARQLVRKWPRLGVAWKALGAVLSAQQRSGEAVPALQKSVALTPSDSETHNALGNGLQALGRSAEAAASYRRALQQAPHSHEALTNLGNVLKDLGQGDDALASYRRALELKPDYHEAHSNLGVALKALGRFAQAEASLRRAVELRPGYAEAHNNLGSVLVDLCRSAEAEQCFRRALELKPDYPLAHDNLMFVLNYHPDQSAAEIYSAYRSYDDRFARPLRSTWRAHANERQPSRRLRVGYVSADFRQHSCRYFVEPLLDHHDRSALEVFAYADVLVEDEVSARMKSRVEHWITTVGMSDAQLAERIRADGIDILVDLAGHTRGNRLLVFARKPAPVSVTTLIGYGYTTGLSAIDWCLTDPFATPEGSEHLFSEQPWRISQWAAYRPAQAMGEVNPLPATVRGCVTFGTLTRAVRINHRTVRVWAKILHRVPGSVLRVDSGDFRDADLCESLARQFAGHGIGRERLQTGYHSPPWDIMRQMDIALDCFPHNSGTTLFESLYMGIPFITLADRPSVGRLGSSILANLGHPEWIARSEEEYANKAVALAVDPPRLAGIRQRLRPEMQASALMDEAGHVRKVEAAYREMWRRWCAAW